MSDAILLFKGKGIKPKNKRGDGHEINIRATEQTGALSGNREAGTDLQAWVFPRKPR